MPVHSYGTDGDRVQARLAVVDEHIESENKHDLEGVLATFGSDARYEDEPWGDHRTGRDSLLACRARRFSALRRNRSHSSR